MVPVLHLSCPFSEVGKEVKEKYGNRNCQVVQRGQGLWVHHPRRGRQGPLRPLQRDSGHWLSLARRGREGGVRQPALGVASAAGACPPPATPDCNEERERRQPSRRRKTRSK